MWVGITTPYTLTITVSAGTKVSDCSTVSAATLKVIKPNGTSASWSASVITATAAYCTIRHSFAATDVTEAGEYGIVAELSASAGTIICNRANLRATSYWG